MVHIALIGDSVFDNKAYTAGRPSVVEHLQNMLPSGAKATLCAVDGTTTAEVERQYAHIPDGATHLVLSLGGNDAILNADLLGTPLKSTREALDLFGTRSGAFEVNYRAVLAQLLRFGKPLSVCTIYNGNISPPDEAFRSRVGLMIFNDVIIRVASELTLDILDLRQICDHASDYANPIEPSDIGGKKIAKSILRSVFGKSDQQKSSLLIASTGE